MTPEQEREVDEYWRKVREITHAPGVAHFFGNRPETANDPWLVNVKGSAENRSFEISVVRTSNTHGRSSYGWFDENKLLISHNGGPCHDPVTKLVWDKLIQVANETADELNRSELNGNYES